MNPIQKQGVYFAFSAYSLWALAPVYFKWVGHIPAVVILAHRVIWALIFTLLIIIFTHRWSTLTQTVKKPSTLAFLALSTCLIGINWGVFIWAVNENKMLSASLGYYINPLINIVLGMIFFAERLNHIKKIAAAMCTAAVFFEIVQFGQLPWIALCLAISFGLYGLIRKKLAIDSLVGMALETGLLFPVAIGYLLLSDHPSSAFFGEDRSSLAQLILAGPVTMVPLLFFAAAANRITLTALGFFQYIGPSGMFLLAIFAYGEPISSEKMVTFSIIWAALALLVFDSIRQLKRQKNQKDPALLIIPE